MMRSTKLIPSLVLLLSTILFTRTTTAFIYPGPILHRPFLTTHHAASPSYSQENVNEFSRIIQPARVLRRRTSGSYTISITAKAEECKALANRFQLSDIGHLSADVELRAEWLRGGNGVEVQGTCGATVTQRCVRTNEEFSAKMEFPLYCIVRPVASNSAGGMDEESIGATPAPPRQGKGSSNKLESMDMSQLQSMLEADMNEDDLMEDEMIYSSDGRLDVGELVAQLFWLKLDPYPKKPGTSPVRRSMTG